MSREFLAAGDYTCGGMQVAIAVGKGSDGGHTGI